MSKGLEALEKLKVMTPSLWQKECYNIIEKELKRLEKLEKAKKLLSKEIEKNRALEIIKNKRVDVALFLRVARFNNVETYNVK